MHGFGTTFLKRSLDAMIPQTFRDFEVVVTDNSINDAIEQLCKSSDYASLDIQYFRNPRKGMAPNTNESILRSTGRLIKILYMDDYLAHPNALQEIVDNFKGNWMVTGCEHDNGGERYGTHYPVYNNNNIVKNTIGSPSVLIIKNENPLLYDEKMTWLLDADYYKRLYDKYGSPTILNTVNIIIGIDKDQTTNHLSDKLKYNEANYLVKKYEKGFRRFYFILINYTKYRLRTVVKAIKKILPKTV